MKIPAWMIIHHGYIGIIIVFIGLLLMGEGLSLVIATWNDAGIFETQWAFQDVIGYSLGIFGLLLVGAGCSLYYSDLTEHWSTKEKHGSEFPKLESELEGKKP